jgi:translation initiation factor IF-1
MNIYQFSLCLGFGGIVAMALLGMSGAGGDDAGSNDFGADDAGSIDVDGDGAELQSASSGGFRAAPLLSFLSPRVLFSVLLGFGAAGTLGQKLVAEPWLLLVALVCGVAFEMVLFRPLWNLIFRFASRPARTLESLVAEEARVVTSFDDSGHGLVSIDLDGQVVQMLAQLSTRSRQSGARVRSGDRVFIENIDVQKNSCVVSPLTDHVN